MKCKQVKELLLTDYADRQLSRDAGARIERHLSGCRDCQEYAALVNGTVLEPFRRLQRGEPSEGVWLNVKEAIQEGRTETQRQAAGFWDKLKGLLSPSRPVYVAGGCVLVLILAVAFTGKYHSPRRENARISTQEQISQIEYITQLVADNGDFADEDNGDYGRAIEEVFLLSRI